jgi:diguanylate cyclase (GGDEF)-like protein/PAS domain S-box-containing protein
MPEWGTGDVFRATIEQLTDAVSVFDAVRDTRGCIVDFRWTFANDAALAITGYRGVGLKGRSLLDLLPNHEASGLLDAFRGVVETGTPFEESNVWHDEVWGDGRRVKRAFDIKAMRIDGGLVVVSRDVTERRTNSIRVAQQGEELARAFGHIMTLNELGMFVQTCTTQDEVFAAVRKTCELVFPGGGAIDLGATQLRWGEEATATTLDPVHAELAEQIAVLGQAALKNLELRDELRMLSVRDPLTGTFNRRYMEETFTRELARVRRQNAPLGVIQIDIDDFKQFNDTHGHDAGDAVMKAVAATLKSSMRASDVVCRYGGEEFTVLMPEASAGVAEARAEAVRRRVEQLAVQHAGVALPPVKISCGVAACPAHGETPESLLRAADAALYVAKRAGRNRVARAP